MTSESRSAIILLSGGLDSMVSAALAAEQGYRLIALTVDYNQRHKIELQSAAKIADKLDVAEHIILPLDLSRFGGSALTADIDVPKSGVGDDIPVTYVPARNLIFLSLTLGLAEARNARDIFIGVNALDYSGYPDCRPGAGPAMTRRTAICHAASATAAACGKRDSKRPVSSTRRDTRQHELRGQGDIPHPAG